MLCGTVFYFEQLTKITSSRGFSKGKEKEGKDEINTETKRGEKNWMSFFPPQQKTFRQTDLILQSE